jgi:hypothetical protein
MPTHVPINSDDDLGQMQVPRTEERMQVVVELKTCFFLVGYPLLANNKLDYRKIQKNKVT